MGAWLSRRSWRTQAKRAPCPARLIRHQTGDRRSAVPAKQGAGWLWGPRRQRSTMPAPQHGVRRNRAGLRGSAARWLE
ncbi:hypothetical protein NDU88_003887 [Pleurodeles waltl]|uniref:Uncharacterized protein n=1 Tax=Pleurodeles waltl TaxID=8319 RepID=A0AAV7UE56_PLEWA|nr:hypothetical protein NDU88_003887 [Pleurodeles waltl]